MSAFVYSRITFNGLREEMTQPIRSVAFDSGKCTIDTLPLSPSYLGYTISTWVISPSYYMDLTQDSTAIFSSRQWAPFFIPDSGGKCGGYIIRGTVKDTTGTGRKGAVVKLFRTSDDAFIGRTISDSGGYFEFYIENTTTQFYVVSHLAGSPIIAGVTTNILTGGG
jgi:hypothetical protein